MNDPFSRGCNVNALEVDSGNGCCTRYIGKLNVFDWLKDYPEGINKNEIYEVRFKNTRKGFYYNSNGIRLEEGDIVAVEASPGHDIGVVALKGDLVLSQLRKNRINPDTEFKVIYRKAKPNDIEKWRDAIKLEEETMIQSRIISADLKLNMKIGDVEYQGDKTKAIFYYIADERVDFRQLIKVLADRFRIRIEMRQIGARQEAGRIGGIGSCGRELCCSTWVTNFVSVTTNAARYQELSLNPQKLAGQCSKLKCCLNYEIDAYMDERKDFPSQEVILNTNKGKGSHIKTDVFRRIMWYAFDNDQMNAILPFAVEKVKEIIKVNRKGKEFMLGDIQVAPPPKMDKHDFADVVGQESLDRFDNKKPQRKKKRKKRKNPSNPNNPNAQGGNRPQNPNAKSNQKRNPNANKQ